MLPLNLVSRLIVVATSFILVISNSFSQQYLVNSEWNAGFGNDTSQYFYKKATVKTDSYGNVYTLGNAITTTGHDFLLMKQNSGGDTIFFAQFNGDGDGEDVAMDMWVDDNTGYTYIVGGSVQDTTGNDSLDAIILAIDDVGAELWHSYLSGTNTYNDIYTSITTDSYSYFYVGGTIGTVSNGYDFVFNSFDFSGVEQFTETYDYAGLNDVAIKLTFYDEEVYVAGVSQPSDSTWDYYIQRYKA